MVGFGEKKEQPRRPLYVRPIAFLALAVVLVAGLGISLYVNRSRSKALQQEVAGLRQKMQEIDSKAETARSRATEAEQSARQSALAKDQAETRRVEAEAEAKHASVIAEEAKQRAATAEQEKQAAVAEAERIAFLAIAGGAAVAGIVVAGGGGTRLISDSPFSRAHRNDYYSGDARFRRSSAMKSARKLSYAL